MEEMVRIEKGEIGAISLLERGEINVLAGAEIEYLKGLVQGFVTGHSKVDAEKAAAVAVADKEFKKNLKAIGTASSLDVAMFGRMVTGDALSSVDAAVHVAHAITTHGQQVETDFFTAVDDLVTGDADNGGGHLGEVEITSPLLYGYYVVDWKQLMTNLAGIDNPVEVGAKLVKNLIRLVAENVVGAKKGSTAPYSSADLVLVEIGIGQPRTLAEAFRKTAKPTLEAAVISLTDHLNGKDRMYGTTAERFVASTLKTDPALGIAQPLPAVAEAVGAKLATAA
jgi:CRISPR system Cascade subunit CasC